MPPVSSQPIRLTAADGRTLAARYWQGAQASERSVVFLSGLAAPQDYLRFFAGAVAEKGWGALTFDFRGVGGSLDPSADASVTADDWVNLDIPAAFDEIKRRAEPRFLAVFAHSIGGQLLGQSPALAEVGGALLVAAQRGIPRLFRGVARLRVWYAYAVFPPLTRLFGRLPKSRLTLPEPCAGGPIRQWVRWGRTGVFTDREGHSVEPRFASYRGPLIAVTISDDDDYAPGPAVEALTRLYVNAKVRREILSPAAAGLQRLGHFGLFHPRAPRSLWAKAESWLRELEAASRDGSPATFSDRGREA
ncbi:MAG: alpha/beta hydrolase family protein [Thermoanaerobaculia bacterium]